MLVIKWAWRYHARIMDEFDLIEDAVLAAEYASDAGDEAFDCIEVFTEDGVPLILTREEYDAIADVRRNEQRAEWAAVGPTVAVIDVQHPEGDWVPTYGYPTHDAAEERLAQWRPRFGDRVRLRDVGR